MKIYLIDENGCFTNEREIDELSPLPKCTTTPPPELNRDEVACFIGSQWVVLKEYPKTEETTYIPQTITKLQAMKQMKAIGKWEAFKTVLANDEDVNDEWLLSDNLNRTYPLVLDIGQLFGFTDEDMANFFIEANKL